MIVVVCFKVVLYFRKLKIMIDSLNNISCLLDTIHDNLFLDSPPAPTQRPAPRAPPGPAMVSWIISRLVV